MKARTLLLPIAVLAVFAVPAEAHFRLDEPPDALLVDMTYGDPTGGDQKTAPCGKGTKPSNKVTKVAPGAKIHIKIKETLKHGGHYRVAFAADRSALVDPTPVVQFNNCVSAPIQTQPVAPVLADGLFAHKQADTPPAFWETDVTLPNQPCKNCTLQVIQFMTPHAPGCYYHHCATIDVSDDAPADGGVVVEEDAASAPPSEEDAAPTSPSSSSRRPLGPVDDGGCSAAPTTRERTNPTGYLLAFAASFAALRRARRRVP